MLDDIKSVIRGSYFQLLIAFVLVVFLVSLNILPDWRVNLLLFAVILGGFGWTLTDKERKLNLPVWIVWAAFAVAILLRVIPFLFSSVPLGYDPGIHKFAFDYPFGDEWLLGAFPLPFLLLTGGITAVFGSWFTLVPLFVTLSAATALVLYYVGRRVFGKDAGILAAVLFAVSIAQFETYAYNYYKNVIGIIVLLLALLLVPDNKRWNWKLVVVGALVMGFHQPAFFIFGLTYLVYVLLDLKSWKTKAFRWSFVNGVAILALALLMNLDRWYILIFDRAVSSVIFFEPGGNGGAFFNGKEYLILSLTLIPFAITGFIHAWKRNIPFAITGFSLTVIIVFELIFHNRFLIYLDVFVILYAAAGLLVLIAEKPRLGKTVVAGFLVLALVLAVVHAHQAKPLILEAELEDIERINKLEPEAWIMVTDKHYSSWVKGYVSRPVVAPGLFDENLMNESDWQAFWVGFEREAYIGLYPTPLYIHVGGRQPQYNFTTECAPLVYDTMTLYRCA